jgi:hypothetical protein
MGVNEARRAAGFRLPVPVSRLRFPLTSEPCHLKPVSPFNAPPARLVSRTAPSVSKPETWNLELRHYLRLDSVLDTAVVA